MSALQQSLSSPRPGPGEAFGRAPRPELRSTALRLRTGAAAIGLRKDDADLKGKIDKAIADMIKDGTYKKIEAKYFDFDVYGG